MQRNWWVFYINNADNSFYPIFLFLGIWKVVNRHPCAWWHHKMVFGPRFEAIYFSDGVLDILQQALKSVPCKKNHWTLSDRTYDQQEFLAFEMKILCTLGVWNFYDVTILPSPWLFLDALFDADEIYNNYFQNIWKSFPRLV